MNDAKMTVRMPAAELEFAKAYAREHGFSLTALIHRYLLRLRSAQVSNVPAEVATIAGIIPQDVDAREEYAQHSEEKHR